MEFLSTETFYFSKRHQLNNWIVFKHYNPLHCISIPHSLIFIPVKIKHGTTLTKCGVKCLKMYIFKMVVCLVCFSVSVCVFVCVTFELKEPNCLSPSAFTCADLASLFSTNLISSSDSIPDSTATHTASLCFSEL